MVFAQWPLGHADALNPLLLSDQLINSIWMVCKCDSSHVNRISMRKLMLSSASEGVLCL